MYVQLHIYILHRIMENKSPLSQDIPLSFIIKNLSDGASLKPCQGMKLRCPCSINFVLKFISGIIFTIFVIQNYPPENIGDRRLKSRNHMRMRNTGSIVINDSSHQYEACNERPVKNLGEQTVLIFKY